MKPQAPAGQNTISGMPSSSAFFSVKVMVPSETMGVTRGSSDVQLSFVIRSRNGTAHLSLVDSQIARRSCMASPSDGGKPSDMVSKRKPSKGLRESSSLRTQ
ncbi:hypothetical protein MRB53_003342 [Persea americana]|uniref:Uncharacterized protein n=1 Tax=Persea americana TaxID=3435 RepID=A0ACC2MXC7_PERAE|nr:hypothetical protein MRB53_003342 [Persea americana]